MIFRFSLTRLMRAQGAASPTHVAALSRARRRASSGTHLAAAPMAILVAAAIAAGGVLAPAAVSVSAQSEGTGVVQGLVFADLDEDGVAAPGEPGLMGVIVRLTDGNNTSRTVLSDRRGAYLFDGLEEGDYDIVVETGRDFTATSLDRYEDIAVGRASLTGLDFGLRPNTAAAQAVVDRALRDAEADVEGEGEAEAGDEGDDEADADDGDEPAASDEEGEAAADDSDSASDSGTTAGDEGDEGDAEDEAGTEDDAADGDEGDDSTSGEAAPGDGAGESTDDAADEEPAEDSDAAGATDGESDGDTAEDAGSAADGAAAPGDMPETGIADVGPLGLLLLAGLAMAGLALGGVVAERRRAA